jgi:heme-degrading monooxygenase HmoA
MADDDRDVIVEQALLVVAPDRMADFERDMVKARPFIAASPGFLGIEVRPAAEVPGTYLLLVRWASITDHRDGFRQSERYEQWRALLHPYYDPLPAVTYFKDSILT